MQASSIMSRLLVLICRKPNFSLDRGVNSSAFVRKEGRKEGRNKEKNLNFLARLVLDKKRKKT